VYVSVLAAFAHREQGAAAAVGVLRGLLAGLFGTAGFYAVASLALEPLGIGPAFGLAIATALAIQAAALRSIRGAAATDASV
jgi:hypothetical protein